MSYCVYGVSDRRSPTFQSDKYIASGRAKRGIAPSGFRHGVIDLLGLGQSHVHEMIPALTDIHNWESILADINVACEQGDTGALIDHDLRFHQAII